MAEYTGNEGGVSFSGLSINITQFTCEIDADSHDVTDYTDHQTDHYRRRILGVLDWRGDFSGFADDSVAIDEPASDTITLKCAEGVTIQGPVIIERLHLESEAGGGPVTASGSFVGNGAPTIGSFGA